MLLESKNVMKKYLTTTAVENISLTLEEGKIYALLGPNGSGKTTFMKMAAGFIKPNSGTITYKGGPIGVNSKREIAYMPTEPFYYSYMTVKDVAKYYDDFFDDFSMERFKVIAERMELNMKQKAKHLSSGLAAKLKIAATLSRDATVYMLDEPLNGIDIIARDNIITSILEAADEGKAMLVSSHLVDELEKIIDNVIFIKKGRVELIGDAETIREQRGQSIVDAYKDIYSTM